ncbi:penicillin-binding protein [Heyndrickxia sp. NPDC080065]|uniref:penicillin-binding protein n=1 Tax=Heyndrickxia sp. NPDC080065 TaxID=3390568 RepID=UPI003CFFE4C3
MKRNKLSMNIGAAILFLIFGLLFFVLVVRILTIQVTGEVQGNTLAELAEKQHLRKDTIDAKRGTIYDRNEEVIAEDTASYRLQAILSKNMTVDPKHPQHVVDPQKTAEQLAKYIDMSESEIYQRLTINDRLGKKDTKRFLVEFGKAGTDVSYKTKEKIEKLKLPGIQFVRESKRFYPNGTFASHLVGYAQKEDEKPNTVGKMGIEQVYDKQLQGTNGKIQYEGDAWSYLIPGSQKKVTEPKNGKDIYLTLDKKIGVFLEDAMDQVDKKYHPKDMVAIVADPKTGKILAMSQRPTFDAMTRQGIEKEWQNLAVDAAIEPGSTMKMFTLATAIQQGVFNPNDYYQSGTFYVKNDPVPIKDWFYYKEWGSISYLKGVQQSSNVAFAKLLDKIGKDTFRTYLDRFHFGVPTNIGLPNESAGKILYNWPKEQYTTTFGQGTTVTPIQMIQAATAIANGGKMMKPYVVDKVVDPNNNKEEITQPEVVGKPISDATAKEVRDLLRTVVTKGTGTVYDIKGYSVTGKTGTAQIPNDNRPGYMTGWDNYLFSFLGMAPKDDPKLIMYVAVKQPQLAENENGANPVKMIFNPVMKNSLKYLNIKPAKMEETKIEKVPNLSNKSLDEAKSTIKNNGYEIVTLGAGDQVVDQLPKAGSSLLKGEKIMLKMNGDPSVPSMINWSKRDVLKVAELLELKLNMVGTGYVTKQNISPTSPVKPGDHLVVNFQSTEQTIKQQKKKDNNEKNDGTPQD